MEKLQLRNLYQGKYKMKLTAPTTLFLLVVMFYTNAAWSSHADLEERIDALITFEASNNASAAELISQADEAALEASVTGEYSLAYRANSISTLYLSMTHRFDDVRRRYRENEGFKDAKLDGSSRIRYTTAMLSMYAYNEDKEKTTEYISKIKQQLILIDPEITTRIRVLLKLGEVHAWIGEFRQGLQSFADAREILAASDFPKSIKEAVDLRVTMLIGNLYMVLEDYEKSLEYSNNALNIYRASGDKARTQISQYNVALTYYYMQDWANTLRAARVAHQLSREMKDHVSAASSLELMARAQANFGDFDLAIENNSRSIQIYQELGLNGYEITAWVQQAYIYVLAGQIDKAETTLMKVQLFSDHERESVARLPEHVEANYMVSKATQDYYNALRYHELLREVELEDAKKREDAASQRLMIEYEVDVTEQRSSVLEKENILKTLMLENKQTEENVHKLILACVMILCFAVLLFAARERSNRNKMQRLAMSDPLTGAPNRRAIEIAAMNMLAEKDKNPAPASIALLDLDHFKRINDTYGHDVGDDVLKAFVNVCRPLLRGGDHIGRFGGEEFLLVLPNALPQDVNVVFSRLQAGLKAHEFLVDGKPIELTVTMSMGASFETAERGVNKLSKRERLEKLIKSADDRVYFAKKAGRDQLCMDNDEALV
jgi:diguanylate cyclase (GGDEF)-like protein